MNQIVMYTTFRRFSWECPEKLFFYIYMIFIMQYYANWDAEVSRSRFKTVKNFWDQQNDFNSHNIGVQFYSEFFWTKVKLFSEFHFTAQFWVFKLKKRFRMAGGDKKFQPPFFLQKYGIAWMKWRQSHKSIFEKQKNGERSRKASLHCAVRHNFTRKTKFFLHIFTKLQRRLTCLSTVALCESGWSRFITLSLHCTCEAAPRVKLPPPAGGCVTFTARLCRLISFTWKPIAAEPLSNGIFNKKSSIFWFNLKFP